MTGRSRTPAEARHGEAGFGLMEVLVVLFITGAMGLVMVSMLSQLRPMRDRQQQVEETQALQAALRHVARTVESVELMVLPGGEDQAGTLYIDGKANEVRLNAVVRRGAVTTGLAEVRFFVDRSGESPRLMQEMRDRRRGSVQTVVLADHIRSLSLGYSEKGSAADVAAWPSDWSESGEVPRAVAISVEQQRPGGESVSLTAIAVPLAR